MATMLSRQRVQARTSGPGRTRTGIHPLRRRLRVQSRHGAEMRVGVEPTRVGLQPTAWPLGHRIGGVAPAGVEPAVQASEARRRIHPWSSLEGWTRTSDPRLPKPVRYPLRHFQM